jgi:hypothetical protein
LPGRIVIEKVGNSKTIAKDHRKLKICSNELLISIDADELANVVGDAFERLASTSWGHAWASCG